MEGFLPRLSLLSLSRSHSPAIFLLSKDRDTIPTRSASGYRYYDGEDVKRLRVIRRGRSLGFVLEEIRSLLQLADQPQQPCHEADQLVQAHLAEVDAKIRDLQAIRSVLEQLAGCQSQTAAHCRLLEALEERVCYPLT